MVNYDVAGRHNDPGSPRRIVFFHPDLGIGGAERLIVDAAVGLQNLGHSVAIFTSHCDPRHCFDEARDGTLDVRVRGNSIFPTSILGRFHILCAILRQLHLLLVITLFSNELVKLKPTVFVVDQLSACVPLLRWMFPIDQRILFYCHFPDQLLAQRDGGLLGLVKSIYRLPFDRLEGWSMSASDRIVVNSKFTRSVARRVFPGLTQELGVIYPCVDTKLTEDRTTSSTSAKGDPTVTPTDNDKPLWPGKKYLLSINRFERKKSIELAIRAYHALITSTTTSHPSSSSSSPSHPNLSLSTTTRLILAGGHDPHSRENATYHSDLIFICRSLGLRTATASTLPTALAVPEDIQVLFLLSIPTPLKTTLLRHAALLLYTPSNEHFGIVPCEAMALGTPVLATDTGGPLETVVEGETGWLRSADDVRGWTEVMRRVLVEMSEAELETIGEKGKERVRSMFGRERMAGRFEEEMVGMWSVDGGERKGWWEWRDILLVLGVVGVLGVVVIAVVERNLNL